MAEKKPADAGLFGQDKGSEEGCEGVYIGYMTEQNDEAPAVLAEKDASGMVKLERAYGGCLGAKSRRRTR